MTPSELLQRHFGFAGFRPGQREVMSALWKHRAALAVFPTGGGKSLCYQLPALMFDGLTLVVSPLIALMKDQIDFLQSRGVAAARLDSSLALHDARAVADAMRDGALKLLYVAPERFNNERFLAQLKETRIALFAVDEAHCISEWGHNFRPDYLKLAEAARALGAERVLALTATATPAVVDDICAGFRIPREAAVVTGFYRPNLTLATTPVRPQDRDALLLERLRSRPPGPTIVYVTLQRTAERVAADLERAGLPARAYHAGMAPEVRTAVQEEWMASDRGIVVATIAFGMGIDKADVRYVYHYNLPKSLESYSQEIGRAGRDGLESIVELFACHDDVPTLENFAYGDTPTEAALHGLLAELFAPSPAGSVRPEAGSEFDVSLDDLSARHDMRTLVLRTALTYLELLGFLKQGTPFYAGYSLRPLVPVEEIVQQFSGEPARFAAALFAHAKKGKTKNAIWHRLNPDEAAQALGQERRRIVRAIEVMEERGLVHVSASDVRHRFTRLIARVDVDALTTDLARRFHRREEHEIVRLGQILRLVEHDGCQTNALVGYFGEERGLPCDHCTWCAARRVQTLHPPADRPPLPADMDLEALDALRGAHPDALGDPRQVARFLCGLTSPAATRARLGRHPLFGVWDDRGFAEVLAWCASAP